MLTICAELFAGIASIYTANTIEAGWETTGTKGIISLHQYHNDSWIHLKFYKHGREIWWRLTYSKLKPKEAAAVILKVWKYSSNAYTQQSVAVRFTSVREKNRFSSIYYAITPSFFYRRLQEWNCCICSKENNGFVKRCMQCGIKRLNHTYFASVSKLYTNCDDFASWKCVICGSDNRTHVSQVYSGVNCLMCGHPRSQIFVLGRTLGDPIGPPMDKRLEYEGYVEDEIYEIYAIVTGYCRNIDDMKLQTRPSDLIILCARFYSDVCTIFSDSEIRYVHVFVLFTCFSDSVHGI